MGDALDTVLLRQRFLGHGPHPDLLPVWQEFVPLQNGPAPARSTRHREALPVLQPHLVLPGNVYTPSHRSPAVPLGGLSRAAPSARLSPLSPGSSRTAAVDP